MLKRFCLYALPGILAIGFLFGAQSASALTVTCTPSGLGDPGCLPTNIENTFYIFGCENCGHAEQLMNLKFAGTTFDHYGVFNILDSPTGPISDQIVLTKALGGDVLTFKSDNPTGGFSPGGTKIFTESGVGNTFNLDIGLKDGDVMLIGVDTEAAFNPLGFSKPDGSPIPDTSDFVSVVPEPSTLGLLGPSLAGLMMVMYRSKKRKELVA